MEKKSNLNKFLTFLENDFYRSLKVMGSIMVIFLLTHITATVFSISEFNKTMKALAKRFGQDVSNLSVSADVAFSISKLLNESYILPIVFFSFIAIILYTIVLWNREWIGSSKSVYTLLTLPVKKVYVLISKIVTILIFLGINFILQYSALFIDELLVNRMIPKNLLKETRVVDIITGVYKSEMYRLKEGVAILSIDGVTMVLNFILVIALVVLAGLIVLLFRSFKVKGGILGVVIFITFIFLYIFAPSIFNFYFNERTYFRAFMPLTISILAFLWSKYLLENNVSI